MTDDTQALSNIALGDSLGVSHATISRIRSGDRTPSVDLMLRISKLMDWALEEQVEARVRQLKSEDNFDYRDGFLAHEKNALAKLGYPEVPADE